MWLLVAIIMMFTVMPLHEFAHGYVAYLLGDRTAKNSGRLTLNPFAHVNLIGFLMMLFLGFGWAEPVPINPRNFKKPKLGMALTALAGPVMNFLAAFLGTIIYASMFVAGANANTGNSSLILSFFQYFIMINISLGVFNLIPIYPHDGSKVLLAFLPPKFQFMFYQNQRQMGYILIMVIYLITRTGLYSLVVDSVSYGIVKLGFNVVSLFM